MPSPEKTSRIYEICAEHDLDYFGNERHKQTIEFILMDEFPDESEYDKNVSSEERQDIRTWRNIEGEVQEEEKSSVRYWLVGLGILIFLVLVFWEYVVTFLIILAIVLFFGIKGLIVLLAGSANSFSSGSSSSYKSPDNVTYGLQRASGGVWYTIAQGPENWMIDKLEQNRAKDNARYRVVKLVNGSPSGTTYS
jgi:hypothetical protein